MNLLQAITQEQLRTDLPRFRPGDTLKVHVKVIEGTRERVQCSKALLSNVAAAESAKLLRFVKFLMVLVWKELSQLIRQKSRKSKWLAVVKFVARNCTTS